MGFLVNSSIRQYVQKHPELRAGQVSIAATDYSFLTHDSYVDCTQLYAFGNSELRNSRGAITRQTREAILEAVENATTVERRYKDLILRG